MSVSIVLFATDQQQLNCLSLGPWDTLCYAHMEQNPMQGGEKKDKEALLIFKFFKKIFYFFI